MNIIIKCHSCGKVLKTTMTTNPLNEVIVFVEPCGDINCYDCGKCEIEQLNSKLEEDIATLIKKNNKLQKK